MSVGTIIQINGAIYEKINNGARADGDIKVWENACDLLITLSHVHSVFNTPGLGDAFAKLDLSRIWSFVNDYAKAVDEVYEATGQKWKRVISNQRLRPRIDGINAALHKEVDLLWMAVTKGSGWPAVDQSFAPYLTITDPEANQWWQARFGGALQVAFDLFLGNLPYNVVDEQGLEYCLDYASTGTVSRFRFAEFLKAFGPFPRAQEKLRACMNMPCFHGYLSSAEANPLLSGAAHKAYLLRLSGVKPGGLSLSYVDENSTVCHTMLNFGNAPGTFMVEERDKSLKQMNSLDEVLAYYSYLLQTPVPLTFTLESTYHGDMSSSECALFLNYMPDGSYMFRLSSQKNHLAVSYVQNGAILHGVLAIQNGRLIYENMEFKTLRDVRQHFTNQGLFSNPFNHPVFERAADAKDGGNYALIPEKTGGGAAKGNYAALPSAHGATAGNPYGALPQHAEAGAKNPYGALPNQSGGGGGYGKVPVHNPYGSLPNKGGAGAAKASASNYGRIPK